MNVYTNTESGFGDFLGNYLNNGLFKYFKYLKTNGFKPDIINYDYTHNHASLNVAELSPYFKSELRQWSAMKEFETLPITKLKDLFDWDKMPSEIPEFFLTDEEKRWVEDLPPRFYTLHPSAGNRERPLKNHLDVKDLIKQLTKKMPVVLLGGNGYRCCDSTVMNETFDWEYPDLINCIGKVNARTQCEAVKQSTTFVGSFSAYSVAALYLNKQCFIGMPRMFVAQCIRRTGDDYFTATQKPNVTLFNFEEAEFYEKFINTIT
jgi:hypothetical protein